MKQANHLQALIKKNYILHKRNWCGSILEIMIPILFCYAFAGLKSGQPDEFVKQTSYAQDLAIDDQRFLFFYGQYLPNAIPYVPPQNATNQNQTVTINGTNTTVPSQAEIIGNLTNQNIEFDTDQDAYQFNAILNKMKDCNKNIKKKTAIALAPKSSEHIQNLIPIFNTTLQLEVLLFNSNEEIDEYAESEDYEDKMKICIGIFIQESSKKKWDYKLRFNITSRASQSDLPALHRKRYKSYGSDQIFTLANYKFSGFFAVQTWMDNYILQQYKNNTQIVVETSSQQIPAHYLDTFSRIAQYNIDFFLILPLIVIFSRMLYKLLLEKEKKIREGMKIMGMTNTSFYLSWYIDYTIVYLIVVTVVCYITQDLILPNQLFSVLFVPMFLFTQILLFQTFFISVFFTRAKPGLIIGLLFFLFTYFVRFFLGQEYVPREVLQAVSFSPFTSLFLGLRTILFIQANASVITWDNIDTQVDSYSIQDTILYLTAHFFFWLILAVYLDQVYPNEFGVKKHPLFFLDIFKKKENNKVSEEQNFSLTADDQNIIEQVDMQFKKMEQTNEVVDIDNVTKIYPTGKKAVDNLSLKMYKNQIYVLLGHNGAGKTTTISMLSGLLDITKGDMKIFGKSVKNEMDDIRQMMGVCPQHDILFDQLTVYEHLELFATFKGVQRKDKHEQIMKMIEDLNLLEKTNQLANSLSGGQKRRLSAGIAFIGNSKFIILDEPTSGLDTSARRHLWQILKNFKNDKIILLTTHFMDEADYLGDRIAIISQGKLKCAGSPVFLKNNFGVGYNLNIVKQQQTRSPQIIDLVQQNCPGSNILQEVSSELSFQLPLTSINHFPNLFDEIDKNKEQLAIDSYGVGITTLEEVFLKVAQDDQIQYQIDQEIEINDEEIDNYDFESNKFSNKIQIFKSHFKSIFQKRFRYLQKDKKGMFCEIFLPIVVVLVGCLISMITFYAIQPPLTLSLDYYPKQTLIYAQNNQTVNQTEFNQVFNNMKVDKNYYDLTNQPNATIQLKMFDDYVMENQGLNNIGSIYFRTIGRNNVTQVNGTINGQNVTVDDGVIQNPFNISFNGQNFTIPANTNISAINQQKVYNYLDLYNTNAQEGGATFNNMVNQAIIRTEINDPEFELTTTILALPYTYKQKKAYADVQGFLISSIFSIALGFIPSSIIIFIIKEKMYKTKHQQYVQGVGVLTYWSTNFVMDYLKYLVFAISSILVIIIFDINSFKETQTFLNVSVNFILNGMSMITFIYFFSFFFQQYGGGQTWSFLIYILSGTILTVLMWVFRILADFKDEAIVVNYILKLFPPYLFGCSIIDIAFAKDYARLEGIRGEINIWDLAYNGQNIIYFFIDFFLFGVLLLITEKLLNSQNIVQKVISKKIEYKNKDYDSDVQKEIETVEISKPEDFTVRVNKLRKIYNNSKVAVDQISFGINQGEVFGLLGVNGAGKTTTFKMLTNDIIPTNGEAHICGHNLSQDSQKANQYIGYCPQFDGLWEYLTVQEHLDLFCGIQCVPYEVRQRVIDHKIKELDLERYRHVDSCNLSGGNKRKLQVAISMMGNPKVIFLDEPSTGMDPGARRFMWNVISRVATIKKQSCIILTTHSMEEAEALCTKAAIMINGTFKCMGSIQHIKTKYGQGLEVEIKSQIPSKEDIISIQDINFPLGTFINLEQAKLILKNDPETLQEILEGQSMNIMLDLQKSNGIEVDQIYTLQVQRQIGLKIRKSLESFFETVNLIESFLSFYRYQVDFKKSMGDIFRFFQENQIEIKIKQYSIKQTSIEQIFNNFAKEQICEEIDQNNQ